ncbi:hypothetical protein [Vibrio sp. SS-MA-C1-2]|nr:hypothetical protein [Vibrio sp. SS-MA-C1-2]
MKLNIDSLVIKQYLYRQRTIWLVVSVNQSQVMLHLMIDIVNK